jgi:formate hydrogenlyase subunit 6/NADH:ubiquinone oxidoreductase subunit I
MGLPAACDHDRGGRVPEGHPLHAIEKFPSKFDINMLRCIYCGLCEEACPEEAIFMSKTYVVVGHARDLMIFDKEKLYQIGGTRQDDIKKWAPAQKGDPARSHRDADGSRSRGRRTPNPLVPGSTRHTSSLGR